jgi:hypothetical protein
MKELNSPYTKTLYCQALQAIHIKSLDTKKKKHSPSHESLDRHQKPIYPHLPVNSLAYKNAKENFVLKTLSAFSKKSLVSFGLGTAFLTSTIAATTGILPVKVGHAESQQSANAQINSTGCNPNTGRGCYIVLSQVYTWFPWIAESECKKRHGNNTYAFKLTPGYMPVYHCVKDDPRNIA